VTTNTCPVFKKFNIFIPVSDGHLIGVKKLLWIITFYLQPLASLFIRRCIKKETLQIKPAYKERKSKQKEKWKEKVIERERER
jgi:hypothetical protein